MRSPTLLAALLSVSAVTATHPYPSRPVQPVLLSPALKLRGGDLALQPKTGKIWTTSTFTRDSVRFMIELLHYLGAYVGPRALSPKSIESVMVTVNSINTCPYCTGLHGQLARMASTVVDSKTPEVIFAKAFAEEVGRGPRVSVAFATLATQIGQGRALSVRALCWALLWGKTTGNSINAVRSKLLSLRWHQISPFDLLMLMYYGPLFLVIGLLNMVLVQLPPVPPWCSTALGVVLWLPQAVHLLVAGVVSLALRLLAAPIVGLSL